MCSDGLLPEWPSVCHLCEWICVCPLSCALLFARAGFCCESTVAFFFLCVCVLLNFRSLFELVSVKCFQSYCLRPQIRNCLTWTFNPIFKERTLIISGFDSTFHDRWMGKELGWSCSSLGPEKIHPWISVLFKHLTVPVRLLCVFKASAYVCGPLVYRVPTRSRTMFRRCGAFHNVTIQSRATGYCNRCPSLALNVAHYPCIVYPRNPFWFHSDLLNKVTSGCSHST